MKINSFNKTMPVMAKQNQSKASVANQTNNLNFSGLLKVTTENTPIAPCVLKNAGSRFLKMLATRFPNIMNGIRRENFSNMDIHSNYHYPSELEITRYISTDEPYKELNEMSVTPDSLEKATNMFTCNKFFVKGDENTSYVEINKAVDQTIDFYRKTYGADYPIQIRYFNFDGVKKEPYALVTTGKAAKKLTTGMCQNDKTVLDEYTMGNLQGAKTFSPEEVKESFDIINTISL